MATTIFKYRQEMRERATIKRPVADVWLKTNNGWIEFHPYIDSGADVTLIPLSLGKLLGWEIKNEVSSTLSGVSGNLPIVYRKCPMKIGDKTITVLIAWALKEDVPALLGRSDVFDNFVITFKQKEGVVLFGDI